MLRPLEQARVGEKEEKGEEGGARGVKADKIARPVAIRIVRVRENTPSTPLPMREVCPRKGGKGLRKNTVTTLINIPLSSSRVGEEEEEEEVRRRDRIRPLTTTEYRCKKEGEVAGGDEEGRRAAVACSL